MATTRGPRSQAPVNTMLTAGASPTMLARMTPEERAQLLKRMKGAMPANGTAPPAGGFGANTILT